MSLKPILTHKKAFDPDADTLEAIETAHEQTRFSRATMERPKRKIARFMQDPETIGSASLLRPPLDIDTVVELSAGDHCLSYLASALNTRRSASRDNLVGPVSRAQISSVLDLAVKANHELSSSVAPGVTYALRPYPSAGALYPCEVYILFPGEPPYRYDARHHQLIDYGRRLYEFSRAETGTYDTSPPCAILVTAVLDRTMAKYGGRGYRFAVLEAGHLSQNILLASNALGLSSLTYGSFYDGEVEQALGVDGINEVVCTAVLLGAGNAPEGEAL